MAEFSADSSAKVMPARFSPRAGNIGAQAAQKRPRGGGGSQGLGRSAPKPQQGQSQSAQPQQVGRPQPQQGDDQNQPQDLSYLSLALQHFNMKGLGRDVPYIVWANMTGNYRQYAQPGRVPWDYLEDG